jgi:GDP-D-mannose 3', 5'-epimerase
MRTTLVTGAGGFIGHHLVTLLKSQGDYVVGVDQKPPTFASSPADRFVLHDIREATPEFRSLLEGVSDVFALMRAAGVRLDKIHVSGPRACAGATRTTAAREVLGWAPEISLERGIVATYRWIDEQVRAWNAAPTAQPDGEAIP